MKKLIKNLILFLIVASANSVFAYSLSCEEIKNEITSKIYNEVKLQVEEYSSDFEVNIFGIPKVPVLTNDQIKPTIEIIQQNTKFAPQQYRRIMIKDSKGTLVKAFPINIQVRIFAPTLVASELIPYNQVIGANNTKIERREITQCLGKTYNKMTSGIISKRTYQKGNVILADYMKEKSLVLKNSSIDIIFISKGLNIKLRGKALADGAMGETILVKSEKYNKTYNAIVKSSNEVIVRI